MIMTGFTFDLFCVPHSRKWSIIVKDKGVRLNAPFLVECAETMEEACDKLLHYYNTSKTMDNLTDVWNNYENKHRKDAG